MYVVMQHVASLAYILTKVEYLKKKKTKKNFTKELLCNSSNTSRRTSSDFQTPRRVEIARRRRAFLTNFEVF